MKVKKQHIKISGEKEVLREKTVALNVYIYD